MAAPGIRPHHVKEVRKSRHSNRVVCFDIAEFLPVALPTVTMASSQFGVELCQRKAVCQYLVSAVRLMS